MDTTFGESPQSDWGTGSGAVAFSRLGDGKPQTKRGRRYGWGTCWRCCLPGGHGLEVESARRRAQAKKGTFCCSARFQQLGRLQLGAESACSRLERGRAFGIWQKGFGCFALNENSAHCVTRGQRRLPRCFGPARGGVGVCIAGGPSAEESRRIYLKPKPASCFYRWGRRPCALCPGSLCRIKITNSVRQKPNS